MNNLKKLVGIEAAKFVKDGMVVGLGTGSTAAFFVAELGRRVAEENLQIVGVTTSSVTQAQARELGIPLKDIDEVAAIDLTVDGADEVDLDLNGIKGGGAALLMEKIVATYSKDYIWIADDSKMVEHLGAFPLPVEVVKFGCEQLFRLFDKLGFNPSFRLNDAGERLVTDMGNHIIDLYLEKIEEPARLAKLLDETVGVVEHGLFNDMVKTVIVGRSDNGVKIITK
ncbi:ribose-5-phosphate isomerase RpiA [Pseudolactococcus reticulitermitis]|uniref:Ribose-5-phosphate isomerase A n=1 Tax=Pseudolactococcus reticulitermitis TaxID=2025039 RepID=A0A224X318_9LACT|nr:ribose-5-phosphate isomerase RpiA [Lactococcus reticulitermitis]GAX48439.1 ribose 5-phosphate isomerase A [Lactococcus reticulitermitis]